MVYGFVLARIEAISPGWEPLEQGAIWLYFKRAHRAFSLQISVAS